MAQPTMASTAVVPEQTFLATVLPTRKVARQVFVAYSYKLYPAADYRKVYERVGDTFGIKFLFADEKITDLHILQKIANMILESQFSIFDISGWNPNVTLELGLAYGFRERAFIAFDPAKTPVDEVPADIRGVDRIQYTSYTELEEKLNRLAVQQFPPAPIPDPTGPIKAKILETLKAAPGLTVGEIADAVGTRTGYAQYVLSELMGEGALATTGKKRGTRYSLRAANP